MTYRIEIGSNIADTRAAIRKKWLEGLHLAKIEEVNLVDVYTLEKDLTSKQIGTIASALASPLTQKVNIYSSKTQGIQIYKYDWVIEAGFLPGVTDNVANTAKEIIEDLLKVTFSPGEGVYTSQMMYVEAKLTFKDVRLIGESLINPLIQRVHIKSRRKYTNDGGMDIVVPKVILPKKPGLEIVDLRVSNEELAVIGKSGIANLDGSRRGPLALDLAYMKTIQSYFKKKGRNPTDVELESIAQTWSEHCKHTIFADPIDEVTKGLYRTYIKAATQEVRKRKKDKDICASVFTDNSGAIEFDDKYLITHKVETHNSPSALDPFGGSITGIVGVNRDTIGFGLGAKPIANIYGFCLADPNKETVLYKNAELTQKMLSPRRIMDGVIAGVNAGGNCSGIPTPQGFVYIDDSYQGKPLVFVGTVGLIPKKVGKKVMDRKQAKTGDYIVMAGGRVGLDGIHGATFSSESLDSGSPATAVQIGDPITQKKLSDAVVKEARDLDLYHSITDNGAGGLSCSIAEMAKESGGCRVTLEKVPLKYPGLEPWQIWVSESQERMTLAVPKKKWPKLQRLLNRRGVEAAVVGEFTDSGKCVVTYKGKVVMDLEMKFLHEGLPKRVLKTKKPRFEVHEPQTPRQEEGTKLFLEMLARPNLASYSFISEQYDHEVQGGSVLKPLQGRGRVNTNVTVIRPNLSSTKGVVLSYGINPRYSAIDPYRMAACAIDTAIRNAVSVGANPEALALLDNFCWCSSTEPERLWQLKQAVKACYDYATAYQTPFISGKDSMFNDFKGFDAKGQNAKISILPTLLISSIGVVEDVAKTVSLDAKFPGDLVYVMGETNDELGGSEYLGLWEVKIRTNNDRGRVPKVKTAKNLKTYRRFYQAVQKGLVTAAVSVTWGGLAIALAKMAMGGMRGMAVSMKNLPGQFKRSDYAAFSETQGRMVATVDPKNKQQFESIMKNVPHARIGRVTDRDEILIKGVDGKAFVRTNLRTVLQAYQQTFKGY